MQSIIEYAPFWLAYLGFAVLGLWCWQQLFFLFFKHRDIRSLVTVFGAALLFTPAPTTAESLHFAPAVFVLLLDALSGVAFANSPAVLWLLSATCLGVFVVALYRLFNRSEKIEVPAE